MNSNMMIGLIGGKDIARYTIADKVWAKMSEISEIPFRFEIIPLPTFSDLCKFYWNFSEKDNFVGFNIALPWKGQILNLVDAMDEDLKDFGSANVVYRKEGKIHASNVDVIGIARPLREAMDLAGKKILVLGSGGAGGPVCNHLAIKHGCEVYVYDTSTSASFPAHAARLTYSQLSEHVYDVIINATPLGKYYLDEVPNQFSSPLDIDLLRKITHHGSIVQEMNYFPFETQIIKFGRLAGLGFISGVEMLVYQAIESLRLYTGYEFQGEKLRALIDYVKNYSITKEHELLR